MRSIRHIMFAVFATVFCIGAPSMASGQSSSAIIYGKLVNNTSATITIEDAKWTGRYGTARADGTVGDRIEGTVAPGQSINSRHRMGDWVQLGERYTYLSFVASFTASDGSVKNCRFSYSFKSDTGEYSWAVANSPTEKSPPKCSIVRNSYYEFSFIVEEQAAAQ